MPTAIFEFERIIHRLGAVLGREMGPEMVNEYFLILKRYNPEALDRAVTWTIRSMKGRAFPTPGDIARNAKLIEKDKMMEDRRPVFCRICDGMGITLVTIKDPGGKERQVAVRCSCPNAEKMSVRFFPTSIDHFPKPPEPEGLRTASIEEILTNTGKDLSFRGIVRKTCKGENCGHFYYLTHEKETPVDTIAAAEIGGIGLCEDCYVEEGRRRGFWK